MVRFATFDDALAILQDSERVSAASLARALGSTVQGAESLLERLCDEGHVDRAGEDGWHQVLGTQSRRRWDRKGGNGSPPASRLAVLEAENADLRHKLREAEERLAQRAAYSSTSRSQPGHRDDDIAHIRRRLRHLLARALHPDRAEGNIAERDLYTDLFKRLWPEIEAAIDDRPLPPERG